MDLAGGNPDPDLLPPLEPALQALRVREAIPGDRCPDGPLLAFAAAEFEADGIPARAAAVVGGALDGIERTLREHLRAGDRVAVEDPLPPAITDLVKACGWTPVPIEIDAGGPVPAAVDTALGRGCGAVLLTPRAQNPTGASISDERAVELRRILRRHPDVMLIENDYAGPIAGAPAVSLRAGRDERWAVIRSTSTFLGPDVRLAVMAGDDLTIGRIRNRQALGDRWISRILQQLVLALWADPAGGRRLARASEIYAHRRRALQTALASRGFATCARSGFNVWVAVRDEGRVVAALAEAGWAVAPGERFRLQADPAIRITTSALDPADAEVLAADLAEVARPAR